MPSNFHDQQSYIDEFAASLEQGQRIVQSKGKLAGPISMRAEGLNANLLLLEDRVRLERREEKTFLNQGFKNQQDIPFAQISSIKLKNASTLGNGYIQFQILGQNEGQGNEPGRNEFVVLFKGPRQAEFERIKAAIETRMKTARLAPAPSLPPPPPTPTKLSYVAELEQLAALRSKGIITEEEFTAKKRKILGI